MPLLFDDFLVSTSVFLYNSLYMVGLWQQDRNAVLGQAVDRQL